MIPLLLALAAAQPQSDVAQPPSEIAAPQSDEAVFRHCSQLAKDDPEKAVQVAGDWRLKGGGLFARQCLGLAYVRLERWASAAAAFEQAAQEAENDKDPAGTDLWVQAGNSWLAANDGLRARKAFDAALAATTLTPELRGEVNLDRGRAGVALGDLAGARADIDQGLKLVPGDAFGWYLSSALALREKHLARAQDDIAEAVRLAPDNADLLVHAGNVAGVSGELEAARGLYQKAINIAPGSEAARAARAALAANADPAPAAQPR